MKRKGNTDYLKTDARTKDGWRAIRTFNSGTGEWRLTALGKRWFADHDGWQEYVVRMPATFDVYRAGRNNVQYEGWFPYELLDISLRQRLDSLTVGPVPERDSRIAWFKAKILDMLESRRDESGQVVLHFESDVRVYLDPNRDWEFSSMSTQVQDNGSVELETFLNTPLRGLPENHQLFRSDLIHPAAYEACSARNCAAHQLSTALGLDYTRLWDEFRAMFEKHALPGNFNYVTPALVLEWAKEHGHSAYFLKERNSVV